MNAHLSRAQEFEHAMEARLLQSEQQWLIRSLLATSPQLYQQRIVLPDAFDTLTQFTLGAHHWQITNDQRHRIQNLWFPDGKTERLVRVCSLLDLYMPLFRKSIETQNLPNAFQYLSVLASGVNQHYQGTGNRTGLWGLDYLTARKLGLEIQTDLDERCGGDFTTKAATAYLQTLVQKHEDPLLALLIYLHGAPTVLALQPLQFETLPSDWQLEISFLMYTSALIPQLRLDNYQRYYFDLMQLYSPIHLADTISLKAIEQVLHENLDDVRGMNPIICGDRLVPQNKKAPYYISLVNAARWDQMQDSLQQWRPTPSVETTTENYSKHRVKRGESLGGIAKKYHVTVKALQAANHMHHTKIRQGQVLIIPANKPPQSKHPAATPPPDESKPEPAPKKKPQAKEEIYVVKSGDSLWKIAKRYKGVTENDIKKWNHCSDQIRPGQKLVIHL